MAYMIDLLPPSALREEWLRLLSELDGLPMDDPMVRRARAEAMKALANDNERFGGN